MFSYTSCVKRVKQANKQSNRRITCENSNASFIVTSQPSKEKGKEKKKKKNRVRVREVRSGT